MRTLAFDSELRRPLADMLANCVKFYSSCMRYMLIVGFRSIISNQTKKCFEFFTPNSFRLYIYNNNNNHQILLGLSCNKIIIIIINYYN